MKTDSSLEILKPYVFKLFGTRSISDVAYVLVSRSNFKSRNTQPVYELKNFKL